MGTVQIVFRIGVLVNFNDNGGGEGVCDQREMGPDNRACSKAFTSLSLFYWYTVIKRISYAHNHRTVTFNLVRLFNLETSTDVKNNNNKTSNSPRSIRLIEPGARDLDLRARAKLVTRVSALSRVLLAFSPSGCRGKSDQLLLSIGVGRDAWLLY